MIQFPFISEFLRCCHPCASAPTRNIENMFEQNQKVYDVPRLELWCELNLSKKNFTSPDIQGRFDAVKLSFSARLHRGS